MDTPPAREQAGRAEEAPPQHYPPLPSEVPAAEAPKQQQEEPQKPPAKDSTPSAFGTTAGDTSAGAPPDYPPQQHQHQEWQTQFGMPPQQQQGSSPATGYPLSGQYAFPNYEPAGAPPAEQAVPRVRHGISGIGCMAIVLGVLGLFFPVLWVVAILLPCCVSPHDPDRRVVTWVAVASGVGLFIYLVVFAILMGVGWTHWRGNNGDYYNSRGYYYG